MAPPKSSGKLNRTKGKGTTKVKFNLGVKALIRSVAAAHAAADKSVAVGTKKVAAAKRTGNRSALKANQANLKGAKSARREFKGALQALERIDCIDQWMNSDPEFA